MTRVFEYRGDQLSAEAGLRRNLVSVLRCVGECAEYAGNELLGIDLLALAAVCVLVILQFNNKLSRGLAIPSEGAEHALGAREVGVPLEEQGLIDNAEERR